MEYQYKGCIPSKYDARDYKLKKAGVTSLPETYAIKNLPRVKNQGSVCSCVAHATSSILEYHDRMEGNNKHLSTSFIYGIQKQLCGHEGTGMYLRDACKIVNTYGDMLEDDCSGNIEVPKAHSIAEEAIKDEQKVKNAEKFKVLSYVRLTKTDAIKRAIMNHGPVLASVKWYNTFHCDDQHILAGDQAGDFGYHAVMLYGWCKDGFLAQNSWGKAWGKQGRFVLPYSIGVREAWQIVDADVDAVVKPVRGPIMDIVYKIVNFFANLFYKFS